MEITSETKPYHRLEHATSEHADFVVINWCLGSTCNFSCSYCPEDLHNGSRLWPKLQDMKDATKRMIDHYAPKKIYFEFTGGEVTLWKDLPVLCEFLKSEGCRVGIISNGSRSLEFWAKFKGSIDHICCSFHSEKGNIEHFIKVVEYLSQDIRVHVNMMMLPEKFDFLVEAANRIIQIPNISIAIQPLIKDFGTEVFPYKPEQQDIIDRQQQLFANKIKYNKKFEYYRGSMVKVDSTGQRTVMAPHRFIAAGDNSWKDWQCYAGVEQVVVDMDGDVYRGWCNVGGKLGHAFSKDVKYPTKPIICNKSFCHCNLDIMTTKVRV